MSTPEDSILREPIPKPFDRDRLHQALKSANLPALVMVLYQLTGDTRWLEDPYRPTRTRGLDDHTTGGFSPEVQDSVRDAAVDALMDWLNGVEPAVARPDHGLLTEMLTACMGEPIPEEYAPMMAEEMGFNRQHMNRYSSTTDSLNRFAGDLQVVIIGAGISGLTAAAKLQEAGIKYQILEKTEDLGGTWAINQYPGAGVDTPSFLYSWSFFQKKWSTYFGKRAEVAEYVESMARHYDIKRHIKFNTRVTALEYSQSTALWTIRADHNGEDIELIANVVIPAVGLLNIPKIPDIPGKSLFGGNIFHSANWPENLDITNQRVAVVGTGASAMQIVPAIADKVQSLTIFQKSPQWIAPVDDYFEPVDEDVHWLLEHVPFYYAWYRVRLAWTFNDKPHQSLQVDPDWKYPDRSINSVNDGHREYFTRYLLQELDGRPDLIDKCLPNYPPFGKRMLLDNGWYATLRKPNVELIDSAVKAIDETGLVSESGIRRSADIIVLATGFQATEFVRSIDVVGSDGVELRKFWGEDDARAYLGVTIPGFPNLFLTYGPNSNLGHGGSYFHIVESQMRYIMSLITQMISQGIDALDVKSEVFAEYNKAVDDAHNRMIWSHPGMETWYRNSQGRVVANSPWRVVDYWRMTHEADLADYNARHTAKTVSST